MKYYSLLAFSFFASMLLLGVTPRTAQALTITPIRYEISGNPGETLKHEMTLVNESDKSQLYYVSFANFEAQGDSGSPTFAEPKEGLGTWMTTAQSTVNLSAGQQKVVPFEIMIPKDATPGGYFAAIFWGTNPSAQAGEVSIGTKTGLLVLLSVNGDVTESAGLIDFQTQDKQWFYKKLPVGFQYRFSNQGGDRVKPVGTVNIYSILGWRVTKVNANQFDGNVLPGTTRKFIPEWSRGDTLAEVEKAETVNQKYSFFREVKSEWKNFGFGIFRAKVFAEFGSTDEKVKSNNVYFIVFPWELILVFLVIGIPLFLILRGMIRRYHRSVIRSAEARIRRQQSL